MDREIVMLMKSAIGEAAERTYTLHIGKSGRRWLVPMGEFAGDYIHVEGDASDSGFQGYGGATLTFKLEGGGEVKLKAPWHSNSKSLFEDTGVDVRNCHASRITVGLGIERTYSMRPVIKDVVFCELDFKAGPFERCKSIPQFWADKLGKPVYYFIETSGGGSSAWVKPKGYVDEKKAG